MQKQENQPLLENDRSKSELNTSSAKSQVTFSIIQAMFEFKMKDHSNLECNDLSPINESLNHPPMFLERGADISYKNDNSERLTYNQKPGVRMSHIYPSYISESSVQSQIDKISMFEHTYDIEQIEKLHESDIQVGLTEEEAEKRLAISGENIIQFKKVHVTKAFEEVFSYFTIALIIPIVLQLIGYIIDDREHISFLIEMMGLTAILVFTHVFTFTSYLKKKRLVDEYNQLISQDSAIVIRNGFRQKISSAKLVKGDLIELSVNARVPADCRIVESKELSVDNFIFSGDCQPIILEADSSNCKQISDAKNMAFFGAGCVHGEGKAIVVNTGKRTLLGQLSSSWQESFPVKSVLKAEVNKIIKYNFLFIVILSAITFIGWYVRANQGYDYTFLINTITLIILSNLPMTLKLIISFSQKQIGLQLQDQNILLSDIDVIETLSQTSVVLINKESLLSETQKVKKLIINEKIHHHSKIKQIPLLIEAIYYCTQQSQNYDKVNVLKTSIDQILLEYISKCQILKNKRIVEFKQFTQMERFCLAIVQDLNRRRKYTLFLMGSSEIILQKSGQDQLIRDNHFNVANKGYTLISFGHKIMDFDQNYKFIVSHVDQFNFPFDDFEFLGTIALKNKISPSIKTVIQKFALSNIKVVLMTGDCPNTARYLGSEISINRPIVVTGSDICKDEDCMDQKLEDEQSILNQWCNSDQTIYARINPAQKLMVIQAYQKLGFTVGMVGFEMIDSPALRKSDIAFAFQRSDELVKQSAKVLLLENKSSDVEQLLESILVGRRFTDNLTKQIQLCISVKGGQMIPIILMLFLGLPLPLTAFGIIFITLVLDILIFGIIFEKSEIDVITRKPKRIVVFGKFRQFIEQILINGAFAASCGMVILNIIQISYLIILYNLGYSPNSLIQLIYQQSYSNEDPLQLGQYYAYNENDRYLGNGNLINNKNGRNPFIVFQFYKHFGIGQLDIRNVIVKQNQEQWETNFELSPSEFCKNEDKVQFLCYSILSLDIAQLGFIYGFLLWGWLHIYQGRSRMYSSKYQSSNRNLKILYIISWFISLVMYIPYLIAYQPKYDFNFGISIGIPAIPILIFSFISREISVNRQ